MLKVDDAWLERAEQKYPGLRKTVAYYEAQTLPACPTCGSAETAEVWWAGRRSLLVAAATSKTKLLPNGHPADFYCEASASSSTHRKTTGPG